MKTKYPRKGVTKEIEYQAWISMRWRCNNPKNKNYGGKGIKVCERWEHSYLNFLEDMGRRPSVKHSIDRIDNKGPYSPENCRWALPLQQTANRSCSIYVSINNETRTLNQWCIYFNLNYSTVYNRYIKGQRNEQLFRPVRKKTTG